MTRRAFFALSLLILALASSPIHAGSATPEAEAPAAAEEAVSSPAVSLQEILGPAPQDGFMGCPFEDVFSIEAPPGTIDCQATCADLCAQNGGTLLFGSTKTGADCTCACCRS